MRCRRPSVSVSYYRLQVQSRWTVLLHCLSSIYNHCSVDKQACQQLTLSTFDNCMSKMSDFCLISAVCVHTVGFDCALVQKRLLPSKAPQSCVWLYSATVLTCLHLTHTYKASTSSYTWESEHYRHSTVRTAPAHLHVCLAVSQWPLLVTLS